MKQVGEYSTRVKKAPYQPRTNLLIQAVTSYKAVPVRQTISVRRVCRLAGPSEVSWYYRRQENDLPALTGPSLELVYAALIIQTTVGNDTRRKTDAIFSASTIHCCQLRSVSTVSWVTSTIRLLQIATKAFRLNVTPRTAAAERYRRPSASERPPRARGKTTSECENCETISSLLPSTG